MQDDQSTGRRAVRRSRQPIIMLARRGDSDTFALKASPVGVPVVTGPVRFGTDCARHAWRRPAAAGRPAAGMGSPLSGSASQDPLGGAGKSSSLALFLSLTASLSPTDSMFFAGARSPSSQVWLQSPHVIPCNSRPHSHPFPGLRLVDTLWTTVSVECRFLPDNTGILKAWFPLP